MITRIEAYRYKCFKNLNVKMSPFQVIVGANGSGKTTLLDIPILFSEMLNVRSVENVFNKQTDSHIQPRTELFSELIYNHLGTTFEIAIEAQLPDTIISNLVQKRVKNLSTKTVKKYQEETSRWPTFIRYEIAFELFNESLHIKEENLLLLPKDDKDIQRGSGFSVAEWAREHSSTRLAVIPIFEREGGKPAIFKPEMENKELLSLNLKPSEPAFANIPSDSNSFEAALYLRELLLYGAISYKPDPNKIRTAQAQKSAPQLLHDASSLALLARQLKETNEIAFERWVRTVKLTLPEIKSIETGIRAYDNFVYLTVNYRNDRNVPAYGLSDGTLSILALMILPYLPKTRDLITIEEPENGIHPKGIVGVLDVLRAVRSGQVWVSSHSPIVVANSKPTEILCLSIDEDGQAIAIPGEEHPALKEWKKSFNIGELFAAGVLG